MIPKGSTIVMLSGGLDSTSALVKMLTETDDIIHAHHVRLVNNEGIRWQAEDLAIEKIIPYCQEKYRFFKHSHSVYEFVMPDWCGIDVATMGFIGYQVARHDWLHFFNHFTTLSRIKVVMGMQADDFADPDYLEGRHAELLRIWEGGVSGFDTVNAPRPELVFPNEHTPKKELWDNLCEDLRNMIWCCRAPLPDLTPCRVCHTCIQMNEIVRGNNASSS